MRLPDDDERMISGNKLPHGDNIAQWFLEHSACRKCGEPSAGILMATTNRAMGPHCKRCAMKELERWKQILAEYRRRKDVVVDEL